MKTKGVELTYNFEFSYDLNSEDFKKTLKSYRKLINKKASIDHMLHYVAKCLVLDGIDEMIEGVGYVSKVGQKPQNEPFSGIWLGHCEEDYTFISDDLPF